MPDQPSARFLPTPHLSDTHRTSVTTVPVELFDEHESEDPTSESMGPDSCDGNPAGWGWADIPRPDSLPDSDDAVFVDVAELLLQHARGHKNWGHHVDMADGLIEFANAHRNDPDAPDYLREIAFSFSAMELNRGTIEDTTDDEDIDDDAVTPQMARKAKVTIGWAIQDFESTVGEVVEEELCERYRDAWTAAYNEFVQQREGELFLRNKPNTVAGWQRVCSPSNALAYAGQDQRTNLAETEDAVFVLFESDDFVRAFSLTVPEWHRLQNRPTVEYDDVDTSERIRRISNPESWEEGASDLLEAMRAEPAPAGAPESLSPVEPVFTPLETEDGVEPVDIEPPGAWTREDCFHGGNRDIDGNFEFTRFSHPQHGDLKVISEKGAGRVYCVETKLPLQRSEVELSREAAYSHAWELMWNYAIADPEQEDEPEEQPTTSQATLV